MNLFHYSLVYHMLVKNKTNIACWTNWQFLNTAMAFTASLYYHLDGMQYLHYSLLYKIKQSANED